MWILYLVLVIIIIAGAGISGKTFALRLTRP